MHETDNLLVWFVSRSKSKDRKQTHTQYCCVCECMRVCACVCEGMIHSIANHCDVKLFVVVD